MSEETLDDLIKRHAAGARDPELIQALNEAAWTGFHDPWEATAKTPQGDPMDPDTVRPFTLETIENYLNANDFHYFRREPNWILVHFGYHPPSDRNLQITFSAEGREQEIFRLRMLGDRRVQEGDYARARELCDTWNSARRWPRAYLEIPEPDPEVGPAASALLELDYQMDLEKGIHQALFDHLVDGVLGASWSFWKRAREDYAM